MLEKHNVASVSVTALITSVELVPEGPDIRKIIRTSNAFFGAFAIFYLRPFLV